MEQKLPFRLNDRLRSALPLYSKIQEDQGQIYRLSLAFCFPKEVVPGNSRQARRLYSAGEERAGPLSAGRPATGYNLATFRQNPRDPLSQTAFLCYSGGNPKEGNQEL